MHARRGGRDRLLHGRSVRGRSATKSRTETIEETAEMVSARGGIGIHAQVDHTDAAQVKALFERVEKSRADWISWSTT